MTTQNLILIRQKSQAYWHRIRPKIKVAIIRFIFLFLLFLLMSNQEISFHVHIGNQYSQEAFLNTFSKQENAQAGLWSDTGSWWEKIRSDKDNIQYRMNLANAATATSAALTEAEKQEAAQYSNLGFIINPEYAAKKNIDTKIVAYKQQKCLQYIQKFSKTAKEEAKLFGIPAAITLAQGLLESNAGDSKLAQKENNHFGIKCKKKCQGCRCANYTDDSRYDMFRIFDSAWYSYREHSNLLTSSRYKHLLDLPRSDYQNWAHGLEAAGYATDKTYAEKLIKIIETLQLQVFDED